MSVVIVDALEEALVLAKYGRARRVSEDVDKAVAAWCFVKFLSWCSTQYGWDWVCSDCGGEGCGYHACQATHIWG